MTLASVYPAECALLREVWVALTIETQSVDALSECVCVCRAVRRQMLVSYAYHAREEATLGVGGEGSQTT